MLVPEVSVKDSDKEEYLRVTVSAENGRMGLPGAADLFLDVQEGIGEDMEGDGSFVMVGEEAAINIALKELVYYPPPDWTSYRKVCNTRAVTCPRLGTSIPEIPFNRYDFRNDGSHLYVLRSVLSERSTPPRSISIRG